MQEDELVAAGIIKKIPELRRASFTDRLLELVKQYDLDISRLWPSGVDADSELHQLIKRRNVFIHQGRIDDYSTYIVDFYRIVNLVELWILQLIGCPETAINYNALNHPIPINKQ